MLWYPRTVSQIFLFSSNYVFVFCVYFQVHENITGKSGLFCPCSAGVLAISACFSKNWPWQTIWHFCEACPDKAPLKPGRARTMNYWLRNHLKNQGELPLVQAFYLAQSRAFLPPLPLCPSQPQESVAAGARPPRSQDLGQGGLSCFSNIIWILLWSVLASTWNETSCKHLRTVREPLTSHRSGTTAPLWLATFFWWP